MPDDGDDIERPSYPPTLGKLVDVFGSFGPMAIRWVESLPTITRIAIAPNVIWPAEDRNTAFDMFDSQLPRVDVDRGAHIVQYKVNRRALREFSGFKLLVSEIARWGAGNLTLEINKGGDIVSKQSFFAADLGLEISSDPDREQPFPKGIIGCILSEMINRSIEIAEHGDSS